LTGCNEEILPRLTEWMSIRLAPYWIMEGRGSPPRMFGLQIQGNQKERKGGQKREIERRMDTNTSREKSICAATGI